MANTVSVNTLVNGAATGGSKRAIVHLSFIYDTGDESNVVKVDRSAMRLPGTDTAPTKLHIASIRWNVSGFAYVLLEWDHTADDVIAVLTSNGYDNYESHGGLKDPNTSGDTVTAAIGDIILTTSGGLSGAVYDITLEVILVP
jgi:hypothetical protein